MTISARTIADAAGLPEVWQAIDPETNFPDKIIVVMGVEPWRGRFLVQLTHIQTAFGIACKLDEAEDIEGVENTWAYRVGRCAWCWDSAEARILRADMTERITQLSQQMPSIGA